MTQQRKKRGARLLTFALAAAMAVVWVASAAAGKTATTAPGTAATAPFVCDDGAGGKVRCEIERGERVTRVTCARGALFEVKWVCSVFPDSDAVLCRSRGGDQRIFKPEDFTQDGEVCTSMCFCPPPKPQ